MRRTTSTATGLRWICISLHLWDQDWTESQVGTRIDRYCCSKTLLARLKLKLGPAIYCVCVLVFHMLKRFMQVGKTQGNGLSFSSNPKAVSVLNKEMASKSGILETQPWSVQGWSCASKRLTAAYSVCWPSWSWVCSMRAQKGKQETVYFNPRFLLHYEYFGNLMMTILLFLQLLSIYLHIHF